MLTLKLPDRLECICTQGPTILIAHMTVTMYNMYNDQFLVIIEADIMEIKNTDVEASYDS